MLQSYLDPKLGIQTVVQNCNSFAIGYIQSQQYQKTLQLLHRANLILEKQANFPKLKAMTLNNLGCIYKRLGQYDKAFTFLTQALNFGKQTQEKRDHTAGTYLNICAILSLKNEHQKALQYAKMALEALEQSQKFNQSQSSLYAVAFYNTGLEQEFLKHFEQASNNFYSGWKFAVEHLGRNNDLTMRLLQSMQLANIKLKTQKNRSSLELTRRRKDRILNSPLVPPDMKKKKGKLKRVAPSLTPDLRKKKEKNSQKITLKNRKIPVWKPPGIAPLNSSPSSNLGNLDNSFASLSKVLRRIRSKSHITPKIKSPQLISIQTNKKINRKKLSLTVKPSIFDKRIFQIGKQIDYLNEKLDNFELNFKPSDL